MEGDVEGVVLVELRWPEGAGAGSPRRPVIEAVEAWVPEMYSHGEGDLWRSGGAEEEATGQASPHSRGSHRTSSGLGTGHGRSQGASDDSSNQQHDPGRTRCDDGASRPGRGGLASREGSTCARPPGARRARPVVPTNLPPSFSGAALSWQPSRGKLVMAFFKAFEVSNALRKSLGAPAPK